MLGLILLATIPTGDVAEYRCDVVEINTVVDWNGNETFTQWIAYDLDECRDWRMVKVTGFPRYDWDREVWITRWIENGVLVEVKSLAYRRSVTMYDPEVCEREYVPECQRKRINR